VLFTKYNFDNKVKHEDMTGQVERMKGKMSAHGILVGEPGRKNTL
jgi:hypothetical protein